MSVRYQERSIGVWDARAAALVLPGTPEWNAYQAWLAAAGVPDPAPPATLATLEGARTEKLAAVDNLAGEIRRRVTGRAWPQEMASWTMKAQQAKAYQASANPVDAPLLAAEATARGVTLDAIVARVAANSTAFLNAESLIAGVAGKHKDAIALLASVADIQAYDINAGWAPLWP